MSTLVRIHSLPLHQHADRVRDTRLNRWLACPDLTSNTRENILYWRDLLRLNPPDASATLSLLQNWLLANIPHVDTTPCFLHCDFAPHNVLVNGSEVSAVLDWELSRAGDPAEDVAWFLQCTATQIDRQQALRFYIECGGQPMSEFRLRYFEVLAVFKTLLGCLANSASFAANPAARNSSGWVALKWTHFPLSIAQEKIDAAEVARSAD